MTQPSQLDPLSADISPVKDSPSLIVERHGLVGFVTLNRPERINAIDDSLRTGLPDALLALDADDAIRAIVIAGAGDRGFCAGADIREVRAPESYIDSHKRLTANAWIDVFLALKTPTIAAIHGICMGGGLELALACDIRIASADARFALPETGLGLLPAAGGTQRLAQLIGIGPAMDMILTNERIDIVEARRLNLVTRWVETRAELPAAALVLAQHIAAKPPIATTFARRAVNASHAMPLRDGLMMERDLYTLLLTTEDRGEAAKAFGEKRPPHFTGR